jgi:hypothetical protein
MDSTKVAQLVDVLNGLAARDALCLLVGCMPTLLDKHPLEAFHSHPHRWAPALVCLRRDVQ